jgi:2-dehydropantoate 2-reductase
VSTSQTRYVVYGAGAVGGVIGGHLHRSGRPTTLIARGDHLAKIREHGLLLDTAAGTHVIDAPATDTAAEVDWTDPTVVIIAVKAQQTSAALHDLVAHAPQDTVVVTAQNGVAGEAAILRRFRRAYTVMTDISVTHLEPGVVIQKWHPSPGILDIGWFPSGVDEISEAIAHDLRTATFASVSRPDIMAWKYRKLVINAQNGVDAACRKGPEATQLIRRARAEAEAVLAAAGIAVVSAEGFMERKRNESSAMGGNGRGWLGSSTWQSITRGAASIETDYLNGEIVLLGRLHGVPTPVNELIWRVTMDLVRSGGVARSVDAAELLATLDGPPRTG